MSAQTALSYCGERTRIGDPDRFRDALFAPVAEREKLFSLYAFNLELAKIAPMVSEPMLGEIRLQWWRDSLEMAQQGTPRRHEIAEPLAQTVSDSALPVSRLMAMIDARAMDLDPQFPQNDETLKQYLRDTAGSLTALAVKALAPDISEAGMWAAHSAGFGIGAARYLQAVPDLLAGGCKPLPGAIDWRADESDEAAQAIASLADAGLEALRLAKKNRRDIPRFAAPALLEAGMAAYILHHARGAKSNHAISPPSSFRKQGGRLWRGITGRF